MVVNSVFMMGGVLLFRLRMVRVAGGNALISR
jgi:hypothetical protein